MPDFESMLAAVETEIRYAARRVGRIDGMDTGDIQQELRIAVYRAATRYDPSRAKWRTYANRIIEKRVIDIMRSHGPVTRDGYRRLRLHRFSELDGNAWCLERICGVDPGDDLAGVDWQNFVQRCDCESKSVRAMVMRFSGLKLREIASRLGVTDKRVLQLLDSREDLGQRAISRIRSLVTDNHYRYLASDVA